MSGLTVPSERAETHFLSWADRGLTPDELYSFLGMRPWSAEDLGHHLDCSVAEAKRCCSAAVMHPPRAVCGGGAG